MRNILSQRLKVLIQTIVIVFIIINIIGCENQGIKKEMLSKEPIVTKNNPNAFDCKTDLIKNYFKDEYDEEFTKINSYKLEGCTLTAEAGTKNIKTNDESYQICCQIFSESPDAIREVTYAVVGNITDGNALNILLNNMSIKFGDADPTQVKLWVHDSIISIINGGVKTVKIGSITFELTYSSDYNNLYNKFRSYDLYIYKNKRFC